MQVALTNHGAGIVSILVSTKDGNKVDVVLGHKDIDGFVNGEDNTLKLPVDVMGTASLMAVFS